MDPLAPPDSFHLAAAQGWLELGNTAEAAFELDKIPAGLQRHFSVLDVRWMLLAEQREWAQALEIAGDMVQVCPDRPAGWLHQAYAARRAPGRGLDAAARILQSVADRFPNHELIPFNLACYACQAQRLDEARAWLGRAFRVGGKEAMRTLALGDEDLKPLWPEIAKM